MLTIIFTLRKNAKFHKMLIVNESLDGYILLYQTEILCRV